VSWKDLDNINKEVDVKMANVDAKDTKIGGVDKATSNIPPKDVAPKDVAPKSDDPKESYKREYAKGGAYIGNCYSCGEYIYNLDIKQDGVVCACGNDIIKGSK